MAEKIELSGVSETMLQAESLHAQLYLINW